MDSTEHECRVELLNSRVSSFAESVVVSPIITANHKANPEPIPGTAKSTMSIANDV